MQNAIATIKETNPIVLTVANNVTPADVANGLNALGASPMMSQTPEEADDMVNIAQAAAINLGTLNPHQRGEMEAVMEAAKKYHKPTVLDPVACGATMYRLRVVTELLHQYHFTVIRGNAGEIATLAGVDWQSHGIDAGEGNADLEKVARLAAEKLGSVVVLSGEVDIVTDGTRLARLPYGSPAFKTHVGTGDMLSSLIGAFLATNDDAFDAAVDAVTTFTLCGQAVEDQRPGNWYPGLLNNLDAVTDQQLAAWQEAFGKEA